MWGCQSRDGSTLEGKMNENNLMKIQQRIWRNQLVLIHIKWEDGNEAYEEKIKELLYPLEEKMLRLGLLRNIQRDKKRIRKILGLEKDENLPDDLPF